MYSAVSNYTIGNVYLNVIQVAMLVGVFTLLAWYMQHTEKRNAEVRQLMMGQQHIINTLTQQLETKDRPVRTTPDLTQTNLTNLTEEAEGQAT